MTDYSFNALYAWLKERPRNLNWGMVSFMSRQKLNLLLLQLYIQRFKSSAYLPAITGSIPNGSDQRFALSEFTLDSPRLSFAGTQLNDCKARLHLQVMSGTQLLLARAGEGWEVREIREASPLQGPRLSLDLLLANVPGVVDEERRLRLDLKQSSDFSINLSEDADEQRLLGEYFKQKFEALPEAQRVFPLGQLEAGSHPLLRAQSFALRTQARRRDAGDEEGAVLTLVRFEGSDEGDIPGQDYRYLIPRDRGYNSGVLFQPERIMLVQLLEYLKNTALDVEFTLTFDEQGRLTGAIATCGKIVVADQYVLIEFDTEPDSDGNVRHIKFSLRLYKMDLNMADALAVSLRDDRVEVSWRVAGVMTIEPIQLDDETGQLADMLEHFDTSEFFARSQDSFEYQFTATYKLVDQAGGTLQFEQSDMAEVKAPRPALGEIKFPPPDLGDPLENYYLYMLWVVIRIVTGAVLERLMRDIEASDYPSLERVIGEAFNRSFECSEPVHALMSEVIKLNFGNALIGLDQFAPRDIALYAAVNPIVTAFAIEPMEHTLMAGGAPRPFVVRPAQSSELNWTCEPVLDSVNSEKIGHIDPRSGVYTPPNASDFDGAFVRLRVNAQHTQNGFRSSALITVLKRPLQINPLLYVTHAEGEVQLQAGYLGDSKDLRWSTPTHGQLNPSGLAAVYKAPATMPPLDPEFPLELAAFTVDEVVLSNPSTEQTAVLITEGGNKDLMRIRREVNAEAGTVQLTAVINDYVQDPKTVKWVLRGPGQIDCATGLYTPDKSSQEPFALITATCDTQVIGIYHGYVVQTLPPAKLEDAVLGVGAFQVCRVAEETES
ncbi:hypothetical protein [Pseudomonas sp. FYR_11]|uniref:hypothetical protein n=1 Tax=Pseudomonas TaxID=286 RepID=UPI00370AF11F